LTTIDAAGEVHPATICITLIVYVPANVASIDVVLVLELFSPAFGDEALQVYVAPGLLVKVRFTVVPRHTGFGVADRPAGADGDPGSERLTAPL
jgi:hypothetical protein